MTAPAVVMYAGWLPLAGMPPAFMARGGLAIHRTRARRIHHRPASRPPGRKVPIQFGACIVAAALSGVTVAAAGVSLAAGVVVGAIVGTFGGVNLRARLAAFFGEDRPAALIEDVIAILAVLLIVSVP